MQKPTILFLGLFPLLVSAQQNPDINIPDMDSNSMQKMMQSMKKVQACMDKIDKKDIKALEHESDSFEKKVSQLCAAGERDKAQAMALSYSKKMMNNATIKAINHCSKMMEGVPLPQGINTHEQDDKNTHICDSLSATD